MVRMRSDFETIFEFRFTGDGGEFLGRLVGAGLLAVTIVGIPWAVTMLLRYLIQNIAVVQRRSVRTSQVRSRAANGRRSVSSRPVS